MALARLDYPPAASKWSWSTTGALHQSTRSPPRSQSGWTSPSWQRRTPVRRRPAISAPRTLTDDTWYSPTMIASRRPVGFALSTLARMPFRALLGAASQRLPDNLYSSVSQMVIEVVYAPQRRPRPRPFLPRTTLPRPPTGSALEEVRSGRGGQGLCERWRATGAGRLCGGCGRTPRPR
jgi:hypothetical protein